MNMKTCLDCLDRERCSLGFVQVCELKGFELLFGKEAAVMLALLVVQLVRWSGYPATRPWIVEYPCINALPAFVKLMFGFDPFWRLGRFTFLGC